MSNTARIILAAVLICAIAFSGYNVLKIQKGYNAEEAVHNEVLLFKPEPPAAADPGAETGKVEWPPFVNQSIADLKEQNKDAVGWITVPHTGIDYPFVQTGNNSDYLSTDVNGDYSIAGTLFMEYRNKSDFSDTNTVIYGHHMKNGSMFGSLVQYEDQVFFDTNRGGTVFLADKTFALEFFAYLVIHTDDDRIYDVYSESVDIEYIREKARNYRDANVGPGDHIITLSTCAYEFQDARMVLLGKLTRIQ